MLRHLEHYAHTNSKITLVIRYIYVASCAVPYISYDNSFRHFSYLGFGEPSLLCHLITFLLASSLFVYIYILYLGKLENLNLL